MFLSIFRRIDEFGWWDLEIISSDAGTPFFSTKIQSIMPNPWSSFDVSSYKISGSEWTSRSDIENVA